MAGGKWDEKQNSLPISVLGRGWENDTHSCVSRKLVMGRMEIRENKSLYLKTRRGKKKPGNLSLGV